MKRAQNRTEQNRTEQNFLLETALHSAVGWPPMEGASVAVESPAAAAAAVATDVNAALIGLDPDPVAVAGADVR